MKISLMKISDYDEVYNLWINTKGMGLNNVDDSREGIKRYLKRNPSTCFVAREEEKVIGAIIAGHDGRRGYIYHTAVNEMYRKKGVASNLVSNVIQALEKEGIKKAALVVFNKNSLGNEFWEHLGFNSRNDLVYRNKAIAYIQRIDT